MVGFRPLQAPLFVPATRPDRFRKAAESGADAIIVDLEDAVSPAEKDSARAGLAHGALDGLPVPVFLRINGRGTTWHGSDLGAVLTLPIAGIVLPKCESSGDLKLLAQRTGREIPVVALVETAVGITELRYIAQGPNVVQFAFGSVDFALDIGADHIRDALAFARSQIVMMSRVCGMPAPLDGVTVAVQDQPLLQDDCRYSVSMGFGGKMAIHPAQVATIRTAFSPSEAELAWARRVLEAEKAAKGAAIQVDGMMIDLPVCERARQLLSRA